MAASQALALFIDQRTRDFVETLTGSSVLIWIALGITVLAAGILRGFSGFGSALLVVPAIGMVVGPTTAVAIATLLEGFAALLLLRSALPHTNMRMFLGMVPAASCAIPVGHVLLTQLNPTLSNLLISFAVACLALWSMNGATLQLPRGLSGQIVAGGLSGFLTGFGGVGGPPLVLYIVSGTGTAEIKRANLIVISGAALVTAIVSMFYFGLLQAKVLISGLYLTPIFLAGGLVGIQLFHRAPERIYQRVVLSTLVALASVIFATNLVRALH